MKRVKVSREVANILKELEKSDISTDAILSTHIKGGFIDEYSPLQTLNLSVLAELLINKNYSIELSTEEELINVYLYHKREVEHYSDAVFSWAEHGNLKFSSGYIKGVQDFASCYGIDIKGVNS